MRTTPLKTTTPLKRPSATRALYVSSLLLALSVPPHAWAGTLHHPHGPDQGGAKNAPTLEGAQLASLEESTEQLQRAHTHRALMAALNQQVDQVSHLATQMAQARDQLTHALASGDEHYIALNQQTLDSYRQAFYQAQIMLRTRMAELQRFHAQEQAAN